MGFFGWLITIIFCIICFFLAMGIVDMAFDIFTGNFHLYNYVDMSSSTQYRNGNTFYIADRKEFGTLSYAEYSPAYNSVSYIIYNMSKAPYDFKGATFGISTDDRKMRQLKFISVSSSDFGEGNYVVNPDGYLQVICEIPQNIFPGQIKGFRIWKAEAKNNVNMRFGYIPPPIWKDFTDKIHITSSAPTPASSNNSSSSGSGSSYGFVGVILVLVIINLLRGGKLSDKMNERIDVHRDKSHTQECLSCKKTYDDSWKVCLECGDPLTPIKS